MAKRVLSNAVKAGAVRLALEEGKSVNQVARELDLVTSSLGDRVARTRAELHRTEDEARVKAG